MIALGFVIASYKYFINSQLLPFIALMIAGSLFQFTILFFVPFYFIRKINIPVPILVFVFLLWTFFFNSQNLLFFIDIIGNYIPLIKIRYSNYILAAESVESVFSIGLLVNVILFVWVVLNKHKIERELNNGRLFYSMTIVYLFVTKFSVILPSGFRFSYLFAPFFIVTITFLLNVGKMGVNKLFSLFTMMYIVLFTYLKIDKHYVYLPYSNYFLNYATGNLYPYSYRSDYNINYFIDRKGYSPQK